MAETMSQVYFRLETETATLKVRMAIASATAMTPISTAPMVRLDVGRFVGAAVPGTVAYSAGSYSGNGSAMLYTDREHFIL